jgi:predicted nucleotide-binding protein
MNKAEKALAQKVMARFNSPTDGGVDFTRDENLILERWSVVGIINKDAFVDASSLQDENKVYLQVPGYPFTLFGEQEINKNESIPTFASEDSSNMLNQKVFIVHGHDEAVKEAVSRLIEKLGFTAIILHEQPNAGRTVIEKFEAYSNVGYAVVLLTPDDIGGTLDRPNDLKPRARQNVIFELGHFFAKLGRQRVCALYKEDVELPSDIHGVLYILYDDAGAWRMSLAKEMKHAGYPVDIDKLL